MDAATQLAAERTLLPSGSDIADGGVFISPL
jgi:hypothetical protein